MISKDIYELSQPSFYKATTDSISLVEYVVKYSKKIKSDQIKICDVGAGCGVVGIELCRRLRTSHEVLLLELQNEFNEHLLKNMDLLPASTSASILISDLFKIESKYHNYFDLIVSNTPYFEEQRSRKSPDYKKNLCRISTQKIVESWIFKIIEMLSVNGEAFLLLPLSFANFPQLNNVDTKQLKALKNSLIIRIIKLKEN